MYKQGLPSFSYNDQNIQFVIYTYDLANRKIRIDHPDGTYDENIYDGYYTFVTDAQNTKLGSAARKSVVIRKDAYGRIISRSEPTEPTETYTTYKYNKLGQSTKIIDANGN